MPRIIKPVRLLFPVLAALLIWGCDDNPATHSLPLAKLSVSGSGELALDGHPVDLSVAQSKLRELSERPGVVWLYRDPSAAIPHPNTVALTESILQANLAVIYSSDPDFSDIVGGKPVDQSGRNPTD